jgi:DICT domain-containing protein
LNAPLTGRIETFCHERNHHVVARLPHDPLFVLAMVHGKAVTEYADRDAARRIKQGWDTILSLSKGSVTSKRRGLPADGSTSRMAHNVV